MTVQQAGKVTPSHLAVWSTDNVIADGGPVLASQKVLASLRSADFNNISDQPLILPAAITTFVISQIIVTNASTPLSVAAGGFYTNAVKGGQPLVASSQVYSALTTPSLYMNPQLSPFAQFARLSSANVATVLSANNQYALAVYLSLMTGQGTVATADVYLVGIDLS